MNKILKQLSIWLFRKAFNLSNNRKEAQYAGKIGSN